MRRVVKRLVSALLSAALVTAGMGTTAYAAPAEASGTGLCEHHPQLCGSAGGQSVQPCARRGVLSDRGAGVAFGRDTRRRGSGA